MNRRLITDKLTNANTTNIVNTEILATSASLPEYKIIVAKVKAIINIVANHGVFLEECTSASIVGIASSYFAIPKIILDPEISIISTVLVVANSASIVSTIVPLLPNALDAASARGALELEYVNHIYNGIFPCFLNGLLSLFLQIEFNDDMSTDLVFFGSIISSIKPFDAAT